MVGFNDDSSQFIIKPPRKPRKPIKRFCWELKSHPWTIISRWESFIEAEDHRPDKPGVYSLIEYYGTPKRSDGSLWDEIIIE